MVKIKKLSLKERGTSWANVMNRARKLKNDEFYTRYEDIEKEIAMYDVEIWHNKIVFCNCNDIVDNEYTSAFAEYFINNFKRLKLKKLICTCYNGKPDLFNKKPKAYIFIKTRYKEFKEYPNDYTGSYDDPLSIKILNEEANIVCTNPPFSKAIDYWKIIIGSGKQFLIISNLVMPLENAYIPYFRNNKVWVGHNRVRWFVTSKKKQLADAPAFWFTNFPIKDRPRYKNLKIIPLNDIPPEYKQYDDSNMLIVDYGYIPNDYKKPFAVSTTPIQNGLLDKGYKIFQNKRYDPLVNGKSKFARVLVQKV